MMSYDFGTVSHRMFIFHFQSEAIDDKKKTAVLVMTASSVSLFNCQHTRLLYLPIRYVPIQPCNIMYSFPKQNTQTWLFNIIPWIDLVLYSMLPSLIIVVCNITIVIALVRIKWRNSSSIQGETTLQKSFNRIIPMLLLVSSVFVLCTLPLCIYLIGEQILMKERKTQIIEFFHNSRLIRLIQQKKIY